MKGEGDGRCTLAVRDVGVMEVTTCRSTISNLAKCLPPPFNVRDTLWKDILTCSYIKKKNKKEEDEKKEKTLEQLEPNLF